MSFENDAFFEGSFLIALMIQSLDNGLKEKFSLPQCVPVNLHIS